MTTKIDFESLNELGLRREDIADITLSESASISPAILISQNSELITILKYNDLKKTIAFIQSVLNYDQ